MIRNVIIKRKNLVQEGTVRSTENTGVAEQLGQGPSGLHLHPGDGLLHSCLCTGPARRKLVSRE